MKIYRRLSIFLAASALVIIVCAGYQYVRAERLKPGMVVEEPEQVLTDLVPGRQYEIESRVLNRTNQNLRIVGALDG